MKVIISLLFFILANISFAEEMRYYDIEVVIIENLAKNAKASENWPIQVNLAQAEKTVQLGQPFTSEWLPKEVDLKSSYKLLRKSAFQLTEHVKLISESKSQRVIFHTAWRQPGLDKNQALPVYFKREIPAAPKAEEETLLSNNTEETSGSETQNIQEIPSILEGILRVTLARYLHMEAELTYSKKAPEIILSENPFEVLDNESERNRILKEGVIHLKQDRRRIRSSELHYIDHPVLGILLQITPYEKPEKISQR